MNENTSLIKIDQTEMFKLGIALKERNIPYDLKAFYGGLQIVVPSQDWDAICHEGSYGHEEGLIEIMGEEILGHTDVEGFLTAEEVISKMEAMLNKQKESK